MPAQRRRDRTVAWLAGIVALVVGAAVPISIVLALAEDPLELRVFTTGDALSTLIVDGDVRVLVINSDDREATSAALGTMARPWEPRPRVLIAPAEDRAATGLWEALARSEPDAVIIAGLPGADPIWSAIEDECVARGIELRFVAGTLDIATEHLEVSIFGQTPDAKEGSSVVVRHEGVNMLLSLLGTGVRVEAQVVVGSAPSPDNGVAVLVTTHPVATDVEYAQIIVSEREIIHMRLDGRRVRIEGGTLMYQPHDPPVEEDDQE
jgi:RNase P/RNase MRP subunit p29